MVSLKRILPILALLLLSAPCWATWTCKDGGTGCTVTTVRSCSGATTCNITVASATGASIGVICGQFPGTTTLLTASGGGTWTVPAGSHGTDATAGGVECAYNLNMTAATTTVTANFSVSNVNNQAMYFNFTGTLGSNTFDTSNTVDDSVACTSCNAVALTLGTANNYILIQTSSCSGSCSTLSQSYTASNLSGDGIAYKINVSAAGTLPVWTSASGRVAGGAIAIYEIAGGATPVCTIALMGAGPC